MKNRSIWKSAYEITAGQSRGESANGRRTTCGSRLVVTDGAQPFGACRSLGTVTAAFQPPIGTRDGGRHSLPTSMAKSAMRAASSQMGRQVVRGILGGILGGGGRR